MTKPNLKQSGSPIETARDGTILRHPDRPVMKKRPLKAYRHFRNLLKDKENTEEVFHIFDALPSRRYSESLRNFTLSENGDRVRAAEPFLPPILDDHATLRKLPTGSVAHAYCDFMEAEGLTAAGLVEESQKSWTHNREFDDLVKWYGNRMRDTHDLLHVLTGYGRDGLGEQCVLAFTHGQDGSFGNLFIGYLGAIEMRRNIKSDAPVLGAVREAQVKGRDRPRLAQHVISDILAMPLEEARAQFGITDPVQYRECHRIWRQAGRDPYDLLGVQAAAA